MSPFHSHTFLIFFLILPPRTPARQSPKFSPDPATIIPAEDENHKWHDFERFLDSRRGDHVNGMLELRKYFHRFGYLQEKDLNFTDEFDALLEHAVVRYQARLGLKVSGELDSDTLSQIMVPRCGVPDSSPTLHAARHYAFFAGQPRWSRPIPMTLTYALSPENAISSLTPSDIGDAFRRAFVRWASVIPVTFSETNDYGFADIKIGFYSGDHGDGEPFDGVLGILAHSFSPESGRFHLDAAEKWAVDFGAETSSVAVDLESVATHEIGHILGLAHTSVKEAIMYPSLKPRQRKVSLKLDDVKGIQALYGSNPNFTFVSSLESDISSNQAMGLGVSSSVWMTLLLNFGLLGMHVIVHGHLFRM
ncbi:hypothetical protein U1Q18_023325 [Sarracenia purpurea var. burkii]